MEEVILIGIMFFVFGTVFGSFFNVVGYRLPNELSIVKPPSRCPNCNHRLTVIELIPIISYIIQKGKCKKCGKKIQMFYPIFEFISGLMFLLSYLVFGLTPHLVISLIFVSTLIIIIISDIKYMIIPDEVIIFSGVALFISRLIIFGFNNIHVLVFDVTIPFIFLLLIKLLGDKIFKKESMGGGDIKLMIIFGLVIGWEMAVFSIFLASFIAFPISLFAFFKENKNILPFGPYLSIAALIIYFFQIDFDFIFELLV